MQNLLPGRSRYRVSEQNPWSILFDSICSIVAIRCKVRMAGKLMRFSKLNLAPFHDAKGNFETICLHHQKSMERSSSSYDDHL